MFSQILERLANIEEQFVQQKDVISHLQEENTKLKTCLGSVAVNNYLSSVRQKILQEKQQLITKKLWLCTAEQICLIETKCVPKNGQTVFHDNNEKKGFVMYTDGDIFKGKFKNKTINSGFYFSKQSIAKGHYKDFDGEYVNLTNGIEFDKVIFTMSNGVFIDGKLHKGIRMNKDGSVEKGKFVDGLLVKGVCDSGSGSMKSGDFIKGDLVNGFLFYQKGRANFSRRITNKRIVGSYNCCFDVRAVAVEDHDSEDDDSDDNDSDDNDYDDYDDYDV
jgi:hypothetical protein